MSRPPGHALQQREQLDLFRALPGEDMAPRDAQDLMAYPFFSLAKSRRTAPIDFCSGNITIRVEGTQEHGIATIWDADILIWAASQIVEAKDTGIQPSRRMQATPYEILRYIGRGKSLRDYQRLKAALDRLQSTTVATSIRETTGRRLHRFSWINEWKELADARGTPLGIELILPDWFYAGVLDAALVLTIDPIVVRQNWLDAYDYTIDRGAAVLNDYARVNDPFARIGKELVTVQITSVVRASDASLNVRWTERRYVNGAAAGLERWTAVVSIVQQTPRTEECLRRNPLGIYVNGLSWSRELDSSEGVKP